MIQSSVTSYVVSVVTQHLQPPLCFRAVISLSEHTHSPLGGQSHTAAALPRKAAAGREVQRDARAQHRQQERRELTGFVVPSKNLVA